MLDRKGILSEYLPMHPFSVEVNDNHPEYGDCVTYLNEYDFTWQPNTELMDVPQLYWGGESLVFTPEREQFPYASALKERLNGKPLRIPLLTRCWGRDQSWMFADVIAEPLVFSPIIGVTRTQATLIDYVGGEHKGYTALSFHKALNADRIESRLAAVPQELRLLLPLALTKTKTVLLIHKTLMAQWQAQGMNDIEYKIPKAYSSINKLAAKEMYYPSAGARTFDSVDDYQDNRNGRLFEC